MIITNIRKNKSNYDIYIDEEFAFTITEFAMIRLRLSEGNEFVVDERVNEILQEDEVTRCKNRGMELVSFTQKSTTYIKKKLKDVGFSEQAIFQTIDFMEDYALLDDQELAKSVIRQEDRKNKSRRQIVQKLYEKGIDKDESKELLEGFDLDEKKNALVVAQKKAYSLRNKEKNEILRKVQYTLSYRGFSYQAAKFAIDEIRNMLEVEE